MDKSVFFPGRRNATREKTTAIDARPAAAASASSSVFTEENCPRVLISGVSLLAVFLGIITRCFTCKWRACNLCVRQRDLS